MFLDKQTLLKLSTEGNVLDERVCIGLWRIVIVRNLPYKDMHKTGKVPKFLSHRLFPSSRHGKSYMDKLGFVSLIVGNMKTWKAMTVLPLGKDPPAITSLCFNHNGKILATVATDGMIQMFDMSAGLQITGWLAHDSAISSVLFGPDETSIFSLGIDGKASASVSSDFSSGNYNILFL
ncbi:unnamed protein product [Camellia sinensis]